jgi:hypothetical protein
MMSGQQMELAEIAVFSAVLAVIQRPHELDAAHEMKRSR